MGLFNFNKKDWKQYLFPEDEKNLDDFIKKVLKYRGAYKNSTDVKSSQLWCAVLELRKENFILQKRIKHLESMFECIFNKMKKQEQENLEILKNLEKF